MNEKNYLMLNEKIRILFRLIIDIIERNNIKQSSTVKLSDNQFLILKILYVSGPKNVKKIAEILNISNPAASNNIDYLVQKRLVSRKIIAGDRRYINVSILKKGKSVVRNYLNISEAKIKAIIADFSQKDNQQFNLYLDKFIFACLHHESDLSLFCIQCGGQYEGKCPISEQKIGCYFQLKEAKKNTSIQ